MKNSIILTCFILFSISNVLSAQQFLEVFKNQDYETIKTLMSEDVSVKINKSKKTVGLSKGFQALQDALTTFNAVSLESKHKGSSSAEDHDYQIAELTNAAGERLRLFIHLENSAAGKRICDIKLRAL